jgi:hypothetical protein
LQFLQLFKAISERAHAATAVEKLQFRWASYLAHGEILKGEFGLKATDSQNGRLRNLPGANAVRRAGLPYLPQHSAVRGIAVRRHPHNRT